MSRRTSLLLFIAIAGGAVALPRTVAAQTMPAALSVSAPVDAASASPFASEEAALALDINQLRAVNSLSALIVDPQLTAIARARSQDQVNQHYFAHTNPEGQTVFDLLDSASYAWTSAGENLSESAGQDPVQAAIDGFSKSPLHRANMLSPDFGHVGVGAAETADGTTIFSVVFTN